MCFLGSFFTPFGASILGVVVVVVVEAVVDVLAEIRVLFVVEREREMVRLSSEMCVCVGNQWTLTFGLVTTSPFLLTKVVRKLSITSFGAYRKWSEGGGSVR